MEYYIGSYERGQVLDKTDSLKDVSEIDLWHSMFDNLSSLSLIIVLGVLFIFMCIVLFFIYLEKVNDEIDQSAYVLFSGVAIAFTLVLSTITIFIGGIVHHDSMKEEALGHNVYLKYDFEVVEVHNVDYRDVGMYASLRFMDSDKGFQRGFYDQDKEEYIPSTAVVFDASGEPKVIPWEGVDQKFVDSLIRDEWKNR